MVRKAAGGDQRAYMDLMFLLCCKRIRRDTLWRLAGSCLIHGTGINSCDTL